MKSRGLDLSSLVGSGPNGRIVEADVLSVIPTAPTPQIAAVSTFNLRAELDATQILSFEARYPISSRELMEKALEKALKDRAADLICALSESKSARAAEWCPALPDGAHGVVGAGQITMRPFVFEGVLSARPTLKLCLCSDARFEEELAPVFDLVVEILEDPMLLAVL